MILCRTAPTAFSGFFFLFLCVAIPTYSQSGTASLRVVNFADNYDTLELRIAKLTKGSRFSYSGYHSYESIDPESYEVIFWDPKTDKQVAKQFVELEYFSTTVLIYTGSGFIEWESLSHGGKISIVNGYGKAPGTLFNPIGGSTPIGESSVQDIPSQGYFPTSARYEMEIAGAIWLKENLGPLQLLVRTDSGLVPYDILYASDTKARPWTKVSSAALPSRIRFVNGTQNSRFSVEVDGVPASMVNAGSASAGIVLERGEHHLKAVEAIGGAVVLDTTLRLYTAEAKVFLLGDNPSGAKKYKVAQCGGLNPYLPARPQGYYVNLFDLLSDTIPLVAAVGSDPWSTTLLRHGVTSASWVTDDICTILLGRYDRSYSYTTSFDADPEKAYLLYSVGGFGRDDFEIRLLDLSNDNAIDPLPTLDVGAAVSAPGAIRIANLASADSLGVLVDNQRVENMAARRGFTSGAIEGFTGLKNMKVVNLRTNETLAETVAAIEPFAHTTLYALPGNGGQGVRAVALPVIPSLSRDAFRDGTGFRLLNELDNGADVKILLRLPDGRDTTMYVENGAVTDFLLFAAGEVNLTVQSADANPQTLLTVAFTCSLRRPNTLVLTSNSIDWYMTLYRVVEGAGRGSTEIELLAEVSRAPSDPEVRVAGLAAFPNPARDRFFMTGSLERGGQASLELYNVKGESVRTTPMGLLPRGEFSLNLTVNDLPTGTYQAVLNVDGDQIWVGEIVVKR